MCLAAVIVLPTALLVVLWLLKFNLVIEVTVFIYYYSMAVTVICAICIQYAAANKHCTEKEKKKSETSAWKKNY